MLAGILLLSPLAAASSRPLAPHITSNNASVTSTINASITSTSSAGRAASCTDDGRADDCGSLATAAPPGARARRTAAPGHAPLERVVPLVLAAAREPRDPPPASPAIGPLVARATSSATRSSPAAERRSTEHTERTEPRDPPASPAFGLPVARATSSAPRSSSAAVRRSTEHIEHIALDDPLATSAPQPDSPIDGTNLENPTTTVDAPLDTIVLRAEGLDVAALRAALMRRRPDLVVRDDAPADATRSAFVEIVATPPDVALDVVLADGRAWRRTLRPGNAPGERAAARLLVQLLAAIAERRAEPERRNVPLPAWTREAPPAPHTIDAAPGPGADPSPAHVPEPPPAHVPEPPPADEPPPARPADRPQPPAQPSAPRPVNSRSLELGLGGDFTALLGLSPPRDISPLRGLGGALRLDLRLPRGLVLGLHARGLARGADGFALARLRGAATVGHAYRRGRFELLTSAGLSFETWRVRQAGNGVYYAEPGANTRPLLIGGLVRAAPGVRLIASRRVAVRLGAWLELAGSMLPTGAAARLSATRHDGRPPTPLFALGGLELAMGVELAAWFTLRTLR